MALFHCLLPGQPSTLFSGKPLTPDRLNLEQLPCKSRLQHSNNNGGKDRTTIRCEIMCATAKGTVVQPALCWQTSDKYRPQKSWTALNAVKNDVAAESENATSGGLMNQPMEREGGNVEEGAAISRKEGFRIVEARTPEDVRAAATLRSIAFFTLPKDRAGAYADAYRAMRARDEVGSLALKLNASAPGFGTVVCLLAVAGADPDAETQAEAGIEAKTHASEQGRSSRSSSSSTGSAGSEGLGFGSAAIGSGLSTGLHEWGGGGHRAKGGSCPTPVSITMAGSQIGGQSESEESVREQNERAEILARIVGEWEAKEERNSHMDIGAPVTDGHGWCTPVEAKNLQTPNGLLIGSLDLNITPQLPGELLEGLHPLTLSLPPVTSRAYISNVCVAPNVRRLGIGERLISDVILTARRMGVQHLYIHVEKQNEAAVRLYRKAGFEQEQEEGVEVARRMCRPPRYLLHMAL